MRKPGGHSCWVDEASPWFASLVSGLLAAVELDDLRTVSQTPRSGPAPKIPSRAQKRKVRPAPKSQNLVRSQLEF